jgi:hypothetical protein
VDELGKQRQRLHDVLVALWREKWAQHWRRQAETLGRSPINYERKPSELRHPLFAVELLAGIRQKCEAGTDLDEQERSYLAEAIKGILAEYERIKRDHADDQRKPILRADIALGLVRQRGRTNETLSDRNIRIYKRIEALRAESAGQDIWRIYETVKGEANRGDFDSSEKGDVRPGVDYRDNQLRHPFVEADAIAKIHEEVRRELQGTENNPRVSVDHAPRGTG